MLNLSMKKTDESPSPERERVWSVFLLIVQLSAHNTSRLFVLALTAHSVVLNVTGNKWKGTKNLNVLVEQILTHMCKGLAAS